MHDIRLIRDNPEAFDEALQKRFLPPQADEILRLDRKRREALTRQQEAETERNALSKQIGQAKAKGDEDTFNKLRSDVDRLKGVLEESGTDAAKFEEVLNQHLAGLPNLPADDVPVGEDEDANEEVRGWGDPRTFDFEPKDHVDLGEGLELLDFERAAAISGSRFAALSGGLARMERALAQFMLDLHTQEHGFTEVSPPYLVRDEAMYGTGQLPKFAEDSFHTDNGYWLIPTSEVPLTNLFRDTIHAEANFPARLTAFTPCFRFRGRLGRARYAGPDPDAPVPQGRDGLRDQAGRLRCRT